MSEYLTVARVSRSYGSIFRLTGVDNLLLNSMLQTERLDYQMLPGTSIEGIHTLFCSTLICCYCCLLAQSLLKRMLAQNPANRDSASEILHNPWLTVSLTLVYKKTDLIFSTFLRVTLTTERYA